MMIGFKVKAVFEFWGGGILRFLTCLRSQIVLQKKILTLCSNFAVILFLYLVFQ